MATKTANYNAGSSYAQLIANPNFQALRRAAITRPQLQTQVNQIIKQATSPTSTASPVATAINNAASTAASVASLQPQTQAQPVQQQQPKAQPVQQPNKIDVLAQQIQQLQEQLAQQRADAEKKLQEDSAARQAYLAQLQGQLYQPYNPVTTAQDNYANRGTPYLDIAKDYEDRARANFATQEEALARQLATSKAGTSASYDSAAAGNYVNYVKQQNSIGEQLARQGIRGGASESALTRIGNNYALNQGNTAASRAAAIGALQNSYDTNLANLRQSLEQAVMDNRMTLQQAQAQYDDALQQRAAEEIRYNTETERAIKERADDILRELNMRNEDLDRAGRERLENWAREDVLTQRSESRDDSRYYEELERALKERQEDIAREERYRKEDQATAAKQYADEQSWKEREWERYDIEKRIEEYSAGLLKYTDIKELEAKAKEITSQSGWSKDPYKFGKVQAIYNRIGVIKAGK